MNRNTRSKNLRKNRPSAWNKFVRMTEAEKDRFAGQFEREISPEECTPPLPAEARKHARVMAKVRRGRGRPKLGGVGAKYVLIGIEPSLLRRADAAAHKNKESRSAFISRCVAMAVR